MSIKFLTVERHARYVAVFATALMVVTAGAVQAGLISTAPTYNFQAWYLVSEHTGFQVTTEFTDEAQCQRNVTSSASCRSGRSLIDNERNKPVAGK